MKNFVVLFTALFFGIFSLSAQVSVLSVVDNNYVFKGVSNDLVIMAEEIPCKEISVLTDVGSWSSSKEACKSVLKIPAETSQDEAEIRLVHEDRVIGKYKLELRDLPKPKAVLGHNQNRRGGLFSVDELLALEGIDLLTEYPKFNFEISDFSLLIDEKTYQSSSAFFSKEQQAAIKKLQSGERLIFENIHAKGPDGNTRILNDIVVKIK